MPTHLCNSDQQSFAAYSGRFLSASMKVAPFVVPLVQNNLRATAIAAAASCTGSTGTFCGLDWTSSTFDGITGIGEQMAAIEFFGSLVMPYKLGPLSAATGGSSKGNPSAGSGAPLQVPGYLTSVITTADRAGAGIVTTMICFCLVASAVWMIL